MCRLRTCCGCCDLAVGVFVVCGFTIAVSCLGFLFVGIGIYGVASGTYEGQGTQGYEGALIAVMSGAMGLYVLWFLSAILMIVGNVQKRRNLYVLWMVMTSVVVFLCCLCLVNGIYRFTVYVEHGLPVGAMTGTLGGELIYALLWIYALVVVGSHHSELRRLEQHVSKHTQPLIESPPPYMVKSDMA